MPSELQPPTPVPPPSPCLHFLFALFDKNATTSTLGYRGKGREVRQPHRKQDPEKSLESGTAVSGLIALTLPLTLGSCPCGVVFTETEKQLPMSTILSFKHLEGPGKHCMSNNRHQLMSTMCQALLSDGIGSQPVWYPYPRGTCWAVQGHVRNHQ